MLGFSRFLNVSSSGLKLSTGFRCVHSRRAFVSLLKSHCSHSGSFPTRSPLIVGNFSSVKAGLEIATHWSPMRPKIECLCLDFQNWSPAGESRLPGAILFQRLHGIVGALITPYASCRLCEFCARKTKIQQEG